MNQTYRDLVANAGAAAISHIGLVNGGGIELAGGSPAYARLPVTWTAAVDGVVRPDANLVFDVPAGATVAGWRGYNASSGGTDYDGGPLTSEVFAGQGTYTLLAAGTGITHNAA